MDLSGVKIFEQVLCNDLGVSVGKISVIFSMDVKKLDYAISEYCGDVPCNLFVDIKLINPWTRIVISGINELDYHTLGTDLDLVSRLRNRNVKINKILD
jgi:hypothetical protein